MRKKSKLIGVQEREVPPPIVPRDRKPPRARVRVKDEDTMICEQCREQGLKSKVFPGTTFVTAMAWQPYYDEDGNYVNNDPNVHTTDYQLLQPASVGGQGSKRDADDRIPRTRAAARSAEVRRALHRSAPIRTWLLVRGWVYDGNGAWKFRDLAADETGPSAESAAQ